MSGAHELVVHEWDFREGPGSNMGGSLVAREVASGGAGLGEGAS
jgi:hypothetical protein